MKKISNNLIYGRNPIREALSANRVKRIYLSNGFSHTEILNLISDKHIPITYLNNNEIDKMVDGVHQGIIAEIRDYEYYSFDAILLKAKAKPDAVIVILDGINDTHNLGAILRCCDVFDVSGIVMGKHNQVPLNATVAKSSAGAINYVPVCLVNNLNQALEKLKQEGFWIVSTDGSATINYQDLKYDFKVGLVIGSEGLGVSKLVLKNSDYIVKIPQFGHVNSLNASVATGILLSKIRQ